MQTIIIEDENLAAERVKILLQQIDENIEVLAMLESVEEAVNWFNQNPLPDFIILDIHLSDGSAFHIFQKLNLTVPVIFVTAFDQYAIDAFKVLSVDYLLKPVTVEALRFAINKLKQFHLNSKPLIDYNALAKFINNEKENYKSKFLCRMGRKKFFVFTHEISFFYADNKIVYLICDNANKYVIDHSMEELQSLLDPKKFFRSNRSTIVNVMHITIIKPYLNHRLKIFMKVGDATEEIIISRERVADFRKWAKN